MKIVDEYMIGLKKAIDTFGSEYDIHDLKIAEGAKKEDIQKLKAAYPQCPNALIRMLEHIDGTYHRRQGDSYISVYVLGSDIGSYPYYLLSISQMLQGLDKDIDVSYLLDYPEEECLDPKIQSKGLEAGKYIHFSDCMNNGGTSQLYIDFNPTEQGICGQIVRYVHDPDEYKVIANSFEEYLQMIIDNKYEFVQ